MGALILAAGFAGGSVTALACGFEDPKSANIARGVLNWAFPNSLYVRSAVWRAQLDGVIPKDEMTSAAKALLGFDLAVKKLAALGEGLAKARADQDAPAFSAVLIGPMLWAHFEPTETGFQMTTHATGPNAGDVVIVTDAPALAALMDGQIAARAARDLGLIRLYGAPNRVQHLASLLDRLVQPAKVDTPR